MDFFEFAEIVRERVATAFPGSQIEESLDNIPVARWRRNEQRAQINRVGDADEAVAALIMWKRNESVSNRTHRESLQPLNRDASVRVADAVVDWLRQS